MDFVDTFDSPRKQSATVTTPQEGTRREGQSPYQVPEAGVDVDVNGDGVHDENGQIRIAMGESGTYRLRLRACEGTRTVHTTTLQSPTGALQGTTPATAAPTQMALDCAGTAPGAWHTVTVTARAVDDYPEGPRVNALLSAPLKVVYSHDVYANTNLVSSGTGTTNVQITADPSATTPCAYRARERARREPPAHGQVHLGSGARSDGVLHPVGRSVPVAPRHRDRPHALVRTTGDVGHQGPRARVQRKQREPMGRNHAARHRLADPLRRRHRGARGGPNAKMRFPRAPCTRSAVGGEGCLRDGERHSDCRQRLHRHVGHAHLRRRARRRRSCGSRCSTTAKPTAASGSS